MRMGTKTDRVLARVNRAEERRATATTASKGVTFVQMALMTGALLIGSMLALHVGVI